MRGKRIVFREGWGGKENLRKQKANMEKGI